MTENHLETQSCPIFHGKHEKFGLTVFPRSNLRAKSEKNYAKSDTVCCARIYFARARILHTTRSSCTHRKPVPNVQISNFHSYVERVLIDLYSTTRSSVFIMTISSYLIVNCVAQRSVLDSHIESIELCCHRPCAQNSIFNLKKTILLVSRQATTWCFYFFKLLRKKFKNDLRSGNH